MYAKFQSFKIIVPTVYMFGTRNRMHPEKILCVVQFSQ
jgi:hypothetical protein